MGSMSLWHWLIVIIVIVLLFGGKRVSTLMGDFAKGIKAFKKNMAEDEPTTNTENDERPKSLSQSEPKDNSVPFHEEKEKTTVSSHSQKN